MSQKFSFDFSEKMEERKKLVIKKNEHIKSFNILIEIINEKVEFNLKARIRASEFYNVYLKFVTERNISLVYNESAFYQFLMENFFPKVKYLAYIKRYNVGYCISGFLLKGINTTDPLTEQRQKSRKYRGKQNLK